jgi:hypothetical protein
MDYWFEASPVCDLKVKGCDFVTHRAVINSCPGFHPTEKAPYYHSGIRIEGSRFAVKDPLIGSGYANATLQDNETEVCFPV